MCISYTCSISFKKKMGGGGGVAILNLDSGSNIARAGPVCEAGECVHTVYKHVSHELKQTLSKRQSCTCPHNLWSVLDCYC